MNTLFIIISISLHDYKTGHISIIIMIFCWETLQCDSLAGLGKSIIASFHLSLLMLLLSSSSEEVSTDETPPHHSRRKRRNHRPLFAI